MKRIASKLDPHRDELLAWLAPQPDGEGLTLDAALARLKQSHGVSSSRSRLSTWLEAQRQAVMQERILGSITSGAQTTREIEKQFGKHPPPETAQLVKVLKVITMQLSLQSTANPLLLEMVNPLMRSILDFAKIQEKRADREQDREKWQAAQKSKIEAGLDALFTEVKHNAEALALFEKFKAVIRKATS